MRAIVFLITASLGAAGGFDDLHVNIQTPDANTPFTARECHQADIRLYRRDEICAPADDLEPNRGWFATFRLVLVADTRFQKRVTRRCTRRVTTHSYILISIAVEASRLRRLKSFWQKEAIKLPQ